MFIGQHGSWNRRPRSGYKVIFVPFVDGRPAGLPLDVLAGFVDAAGNARGRPVGVAIDTKGALLVADDVGNTVWRVIQPSGALSRTVPRTATASTARAGRTAPSGAVTMERLRHCSSVICSDCATSRANALRIRSPNSVPSTTALTS